MEDKLVSFCCGETVSGPVTDWDFICDCCSKICETVLDSEWEDLQTKGE